MEDRQTATRVIALFGLQESPSSRQAPDRGGRPDALRAGGATTLGWSRWSSSTEDSSGNLSGHAKCTRRSPLVGLGTKGATRFERT